MLYTTIEIFFTPFPDTKYEITKSSKDMVNASRAPAKIPSLIIGTITFVNAWKGVAPRSIAAFARLGSRLLTFG